MPDLLQVRDLAVRYQTTGFAVEALRGISFDAAAGESIAILGESGSGKSTALLALMGVLPPGTGIAGSVRFRGTELLSLSEAGWRRTRGAQMSCVLQEPALALHPMMRVGTQIDEVLRAHWHRASARARRERGLAILEGVGFERPDHIARAYPHELSGGQRQRVAIAQALACEPAVLLADEPTGALDRESQQEVVALLAFLRQSLGVTLVIVTHDTRLVGGLAERVLVLYAGQIIEDGPWSRIASSPAHPYTAGLLQASTVSNEPGEDGRARFRAIAGDSPDPTHPEPGCAFEPRCPVRLPVCRTAPPLETALSPFHTTRCHLHVTG